MTRFTGWSGSMPNSACKHPLEARETAEREIDTSRDGEHDTRIVVVYICGLCDAMIDGDPIHDAAEAQAEYMTEMQREDD